VSALAPPRYTQIKNRDTLPARSRRAKFSASREIFPFSHPAKSFALEINWRQFIETLQRLPDNCCPRSVTPRNFFFRNNFRSRKWAAGKAAHVKRDRKKGGNKINRRAERRESEATLSDEESPRPPQR
jgi:hypothetical protein